MAEILTWQGVKDAAGEFTEGGARQLNECPTKAEVEAAYKTGTVTVGGGVQPNELITEVSMNRQYVTICFDNKSSLGNVVKGVELDYRWPDGTTGNTMIYGGSSIVANFEIVDRFSYVTFTGVRFRIENTTEQAATFEVYSTPTGLYGNERVLPFAALDVNVSGSVQRKVGESLEIFVNNTLN